MTESGNGLFFYFFHESVWKLYGRRHFPEVESFVVLKNVTDSGTPV